MLVLVGKAGVGKSAIRALLAERLGRPSLGPDDFPGRWDDVFLRLDDSCILECCQIPQRMRITDADEIIHLTAPTEIQKERLEQQGGLNPLEIARRLIENPRGDLGYDMDIRPTMTVEVTGTPDEAVAEIVERL